MRPRCSAEPLVAPATCDWFVPKYTSYASASGDTDQFRFVSGRLTTAPSAGVGVGLGPLTEAIEAMS